MTQGLRDYLLQSPFMTPSLERLANPETSEQCIECMAHMRKDQDLKPILAAVDARGPGAVMRFWEDEQVLKKLGKSMATATLGDVEGLNNDELVSEGKKALDIVSGFAQIKCGKRLLAAQRRKNEQVAAILQQLSRAAKCGRKKRASLVKGDASALQNMESKTTPTATSSDVVVELL